MHDGGDAAHAVEEAGLQPGQGGELPARGGRRADAGERHGDRHQQAAPGQHQGGDRVGRRRSRAATSSGPAMASVAAGIQRANRPSTASTRSTTTAASSAGVPGAQHRRAGGEQAGERVGAQAPPRGGAGLEGGPLGQHRQAGAQHGQDGEADERQRRAGRRVGRQLWRQRRLQGGAGTGGLPDGERNAGQAERHHRKGVAPAEFRLLAHPGARGDLGVVHARHVADAATNDSPTATQGGAARQPADGAHPHAHGRTRAVVPGVPHMFVFVLGF